MLEIKCLEEDGSPVLPQILIDLPDVDPSPQTQKELAELIPLQEQLDYYFARPALLRAALTLGSWSNEHAGSGWPSNACLEFFGDAVLGLLAADALWQRFPELAEGQLTRLRASLVSEECLAKVARQLDLGKWIWLGRGDQKRDLQSQNGTLADTLEAVIGAVFLDARGQGKQELGIAKRLFLHLFSTVLATLQPEHGLDAKSRLQQWAQAKFHRTPVYVRVGSPPPPGQPHWHARVELMLLEHPHPPLILGEGEGRNLRLAERRAAMQALHRIEAGEFDPYSSSSS